MSVTRKLNQTDDKLSDLAARLAEGPVPLSSGLLVFLIVSNLLLIAIGFGWLAESGTLGEVFEGRAPAHRLFMPFVAPLAAMFCSWLNFSNFSWARRGRRKLALQLANSRLLRVFIGVHSTVMLVAVVWFTAPLVLNFLTKLRGQGVLEDVFEVSLAGMMVFIWVILALLIWKSLSGRLADLLA